MMARSIKYKAWDKVNKRMGDVLVLSLHNGEVLGAQIDFGYNEAMQLLGDEFELMQFTGLHDKNGKEIYEGYIVKWIWLHNEIKAQVHWYDEGACFYAGDRRDRVLSAVEVIGNIHENPEFLEDL